MRNIQVFFCLNKDPEKGNWKSKRRIQITYHLVVSQWQELYLDKNYMNKGAAAKGLGSQKVPECLCTRFSSG